MTSGAAMPSRRRAAPLGLVERLRGVHLAMVDAVLGGDGLERVAELAAEAAGGPVAIVVPRHDVAVAVAGGRRRGGGAAARCAATSADRARDRPAQVPDGLTAEAPIESGGETARRRRLVRSRRAARRAASSCTWRRSPR